MRGRKHWEELVVIDTEKMEGSLVVNVGANEPPLLFKEEARQFATETARKMGYAKLIDTENDARLYGQNNFAERMFYFAKR